LDIVGQVFLEIIAVTTF